jgi:hypothetical protein
MLVETANAYGFIEKKSIEDGVAELKSERRKAEKYNQSESKRK